MKKKPNTSGLIPFKPGQSGNPSGRPKDPEWLQGVRLLPNHVAAKLWSKWLSMDSKEVKRQSDAWRSSDLSAIELGMCRALQRDIEEGEFKNFELGLSRIIGRVKDAPEPQAGDDLSKLNQEELLAKVRQAISVLELSRTKDGSFKVDDEV